MLVQDYAQRKRTNFYVGPWNISNWPQYLQQKLLQCAVQHSRCVGQLTKTGLIWLYVRKSEISRRLGKTLWGHPHLIIDSHKVGRIDRNIKVNTFHSYTTLADEKRWRTSDSRFILPRVHISPSFVPVLSYSNPVHTFTFTYFRFIWVCQKERTVKWSLPLRFSTKIM